MNKVLGATDLIREGNFFRAKDAREDRKVIKASHEIANALVGVLPQNPLIVLALAIGTPVAKFHFPKGNGYAFGKCAIPHVDSIAVVDDFACGAVVCGDDVEPATEIESVEAFSADGPVPIVWIHGVGGIAQLRESHFTTALNIPVQTARLVVSGEHQRVVVVRQAIDANPSAHGNVLVLTGDGETKAITTAAEFESTLAFPAATCPTGSDDGGIEFPTCRD